MSFLKKIISIKETETLVGIAIIVGTITGFATIAFRYLFVISEEIFYPENFASLLGIPIRYYPFILPFIPGIGGFFVGIISWIFLHRRMGHGVTGVIKAIVKYGGIIDKKLPFLTAINSAITLGSGGSAGSEGPIVQIGGGLASQIGRIFKLKPIKMRVVISSGASAGIGAIFNAPLSGVFFALEVILNDFRISSFSPVIIASVIASYISQSFITETIIQAPKYNLTYTYEIFFLAILGIIMGIIGFLYKTTLHYIEESFEKIKLPEFIKPAIGGLLVGIIGIFFPEILGVGYNEITKALNNLLPLYIVFALGFVKIIATSLTLGSGGVGGVFAPALYIGAMLGLAFGKIISSKFLIPHPEIYAIIGMGALLSGAGHIPFTSIMLVLEITGDYNLLLPVMLACTISTIISQKISPYSIFTHSLKKYGIVLEKGADVSVLQSYSVKTILEKDFLFAYSHQPLSQILHTIQKTRYDELPVINKNGEYAGIITFQNIREALIESKLHHLLIAEEVATKIPPIDEHESLYTAFKRFAEKTTSILPIVSENKLIGIISQERLLSFYKKEILLREI